MNHPFQLIRALAAFLLLALCIHTTVDAQTKKYDFVKKYDGHSIVYNNVIDHFGDVDKRYGVLNAAGQQVTPLMYDIIYPFHEGFAVVERRKKVGFINRNGTEVITMQYESAGDFSEGLA